MSCDFVAFINLLAHFMKSVAELVICDQPTRLVSRYTLEGLEFYGAHTRALKLRTDRTFIRLDLKWVLLCNSYEPSMMNLN